MRSFRVLIHPNLHGAVRKRGAAERTRFRRIVDRLRRGEWNGGTRVKRLRGVPRPVYEARLDGADRLLFTMGTSAVRSATGDQALHLLLWDWVKHDQAVRFARRNLAPEAEFLEFQVEEELDIEVPPPHPAALFSDLPEEERTEPVLAFLAPSSQWAPPPTEAITGAERWFVLHESAIADDAEFQRLLDIASPELELKLAEEQYQVLRAPGPILLAGSAGSGKTTVSVHRLTEATTGSGASAIYLSYSPWLTEYAESLYLGLLAARGLPAPARPPRFVTLSKLFGEIASESARREVIGLPDFEQWFAKSGARLDLGLVGEELRSILKGACLDLGRSMLEREAYFELGRKRAPLFANERPEIHRIGEQYQLWLDRQGRQDQLDLCRAALKETRSGRVSRYDVVVCDEVQDLTELEIAFVLSLSAHQDQRGTFLGGDTQQVIHPSGFRWAEVKQAILRAERGSRREAPTLHRLRRNYRSVRPIVQVANAVLALRRQIFGRTEEDEPEDSPLAGPVPLLLSDTEDAVLSGVEGFGPRCAVLTLDDAETERLRSRLSTSRVFHVRDAKGLEFDSVVLWKALTFERNLVESRLRNDGRRLDNEPRFRRFLQWLYVALTRPRRHLAVFEEEALLPFWEAPRFRGLLEKDNASTLPRTFRATAAPDAWRSEAAYYEKRGRFRQAAECFRRAGDASEESRASALGAEATSSWEEALVHWRAIGRGDCSARCLEKLSRYEEAESEYRRAGFEKEADICRARVLESRGHFGEAAELLEKLGDREGAARCWKRTARGARSQELELELAMESKDWAKAAPLLKALGRRDEAAAAFRKAGQTKEANRLEAEAHAEQGRHDKAAAAYRRAGLTKEAAFQRAKSQVEAGSFLTAARGFERLDKLAEAADAYRAGGMVRRAAYADIRRLGTKSGVLERVNELHQAGRDDEAEEWIDERLDHLGSVNSPARRYVGDGEHSEVRALLRIQHRITARRLERASEFRDAAEEWDLAGDPEAAAKARAAYRASRPPPISPPPPPPTPAKPVPPAPATQRSSAPTPEAAPRPREVLPKSRDPFSGRSPMPPIPRRPQDLDPKTIEILTTAAAEAMKARRPDLAAERWSLLGRWKEECECLEQAIAQEERWIETLKTLGPEQGHELGRADARLARYEGFLADARRKLSP